MAVRVRPCLQQWFLWLFFFNDTATTEIYTLSLHDALPISSQIEIGAGEIHVGPSDHVGWRSEEHTSELQSRFDLVCRLLLEKKKLVSTPGILSVAIASARADLEGVDVPIANASEAVQVAVI